MVPEWVTSGLASASEASACAGELSDTPQLEPTNVIAEKKRMPVVLFILAPPDS
jgi:hypothetical protein